jgi:hypothetical protein
MAKFSMKQGGKEVGPASTYAKPHDMSGSQVDLGYKDGTNPGFGENLSKGNNVDMSVGYISNSAGNEPIKTTGIKIRGTGAATKGTMSRGPMA